MAISLYFNIVIVKLMPSTTQNLCVDGFSHARFARPYLTTNEVIISTLYGGRQWAMPTPK